MREFGVRDLVSGICGELSRGRGSVRRDGSASEQAEASWMAQVRNGGRVSDIGEIDGVVLECRRAFE
jgi:hypothetical protein